MEKWYKIFEWSKKAGSYFDGEAPELSLDSEHPVIRRVVERLAEPAYLYNKLKEQQRFDAEKAFQKLHRRNRRRLFIRISEIAAAIALILGTIILNPTELSRKQEPTQTVTINQTFSPGTSKAILHLADGRTIVMDDTTHQKNIGTEGGIIKIDPLKVVYETTTDSLNLVTTENHILNVPRGGEFCLTLADGTQVWLNSETELHFPVRFSKESRQVYLKGEAYFDVKKNTDSPFIVTTPVGDIKVLGTSFNITAYDTTTLIATLETGSISYSKSVYKDIFLKPGEQLIYQSHLNELNIKKVNTKLYTAWKDHLFCFEEQNLEQILTTLSRWYDFQVVFESEESKKIELSGTLDRFSDIKPLLKLFELGTNVKFKIQDKIIYVQEVK